MGLLVVVISIGLFFLCNTLFKQGIAFMRNLPVYLDIIASHLDNVCSSCDEILGLAVGTARNVMDDHMFQVVDKVRVEVMPGITQRTIGIAIKIIGGLGMIIITFISSILIAKDYPAFKEKMKKQSFYKEFQVVSSRLSDVGLAYLRAQLIIIGIVAAICSIGLVLIKNKYALLLGIGIALMDALPIFGSGIVLIPWSIIMILNGNVYVAAILITSYLLCLITREVLEPKLIGNRIGIKPLFTLMAMFIGLNFFNTRFCARACGLVIIVTVSKTLSEKSAYRQ